ncbi:hypothetical protein [Paraburkholderia sp. GAS348]|uniref:hypothetical protein n=1 Tax=Paraburkholderia sp. GAS348 TaxID=3035132 RepID=UPI003D24DBBC
MTVISLNARKDHTACGLMAQIKAEIADMSPEELLAGLTSSVARMETQELEQGRLLSGIRDDESYKEHGYKSVYQFAEKELGISTRETNRLMKKYADGGTQEQQQADVAPEHRYTFVDENGKDVTAEVYAEAERIQETLKERALEARARRAAKRAGFRAIKSRARTYCFSNQLGFQVLDAFSGFPVYGWNYELTAQDVIDWCTDDTE